MTTSRNNHFVIVLEGANGVGKSTQARLLHKAISTQARLLHKAISTYKKDEVWRFHDGNDIKTSGNSSVTAALKYSANRAHLCRDIFPELPSRNIILLDRFWPSTLVYQGTEPGMCEHIHALNRMACGEYYEADAWCFLHNEIQSAAAERYLYLSQVSWAHRPSWRFQTGGDTSPDQTCAQIVEWIMPKIAAWRTTL